MPLGFDGAVVSAGATGVAERSFDGTLSPTAFDAVTL